MLTRHVCLAAWLLLAEPVVQEVCKTFRQRLDNKRLQLLRARAKRAAAQGQGVEAAAGGDGLRARAASSEALAEAEAEALTVGGLRADLEALLRLPHDDSSASGYGTSSAISSLVARTAALMTTSSKGRSSDAAADLHAALELGVDVALMACRRTQPTPSAAKEQPGQAARSEVWTDFWEALAGLACKLSTAAATAPPMDGRASEAAALLRKLLRDEKAVESVFLSLHGDGAPSVGSGQGPRGFSEWWLKLLRAGAVTPLQSEDCLLRLLNGDAPETVEACRELVGRYNQEIYSESDAEQPPSRPGAGWRHSGAFVSLQELLACMSVSADEAAQ